MVRVVRSPLVVRWLVRVRLLLVTVLVVRVLHVGASGYLAVTAQCSTFVTNIIRRDCGWHLVDFIVITIKAIVLANLLDEHFLVIISSVCIWVSCIGSVGWWDIHVTFAIFVVRSLFVVTDLSEILHDLAMFLGYFNCWRQNRLIRRLCTNIHKSVDINFESLDFNHRLTFPLGDFVPALKSFGHLCDMTHGSFCRAAVIILGL